MNKKRHFGMILNNKLYIISVITGGAGQQLLMSAAAAQVSSKSQDTS